MTNYRYILCFSIHFSIRWPIIVFPDQWLMQLDCSMLSPPGERREKTRGSRAKACTKIHITLVCIYSGVQIRITTVLNKIHITTVHWFIENRLFRYFRSLLYWTRSILQLYTDSKKIDYIDTSSHTQNYSLKLTFYLWVMDSYCMRYTCIKCFCCLWIPLSTHIWLT
jgi:hypothetical protein